MSYPDDPVEMIPIDDDTRLVVYYDPDVTNPLDDHVEGVSVHTLTVNRIFRSAPPAGDDSHGDAIDTIIDALWRSDDDVSAALATHFARAGLPHRIVDMTTDRDWVGRFVWYLEPETVAENQALAPLWTGLDYLDGVIAEYEQWARGEVYIVQLQKRVVWRRVDAPEDRETWEVSDSIGKCYLNETDTAVDVAREHFDIDIPEEG